MVTEWVNKQTLSEEKSWAIPQSIKLKKNLWISSLQLTVSHPLHYFFLTLFPIGQGERSSSLRSSKEVLYTCHFKSHPSLDMKWNSCTDEKWFIGGFSAASDLCLLSVHKPAQSIASSASEASVPYRDAMLNCFVCLNVECFIQPPFSQHL